MERLLKVAELNDLIKQVTKGEITFSKMTEIINIKHVKELSELRYKLKSKERVFSESEISQLQSAVHKITGDGEVMMLFNLLLGVNAGGGS